MVKKMSYCHPKLLTLRNCLIRELRLDRKLLSRELHTEEYGRRKEKMRMRKKKN